MPNGGVILLGDDLVFLTALSSELRSVSRSILISAGPRPVKRALSKDRDLPAVAIVCLDGSENIGEVRQLMSQHSRTTFLFLSPASPPRAALAHAVHSGRSEIMSSRDEPLVIAATVIALLAQKRVVPDQS
jgi:hypothetical protein